MDCISVCSTEVRPQSSSVRRNVFHLCFKANYCHEIFNEVQVEKRCEEIFRKVTEEHLWILREIGFDKDHVHITIDAGTKGPEDVAKALKGNSGRKILKEFPYLKKKYFWGSGLWSPVIYFDSLGERTIMEMDDYTRNQGMPKKYLFKSEQSCLDDFAS